MQTNETLMGTYGQFGYQPDKEGLVNLFNYTYIRKILLKVYHNDNVLVKYTRENLIAECRVGFNQEKRLVLKEIKTIDNQSVLFDIAANDISECISIKRNKCTSYYFKYEGLTYCFDVLPYPDNFTPKPMFDKYGQVVFPIFTCDLLKVWDGFKEMTPQEFYDVFTIEGKYIPVVNVTVTDYFLNSNDYLNQNSVLLKNKIKGVYFRHEINEDGTESIVVHKGKVKGKGGYDSDFVMSVPCNQISACIYRDGSLSSKDSTKTIQFAFNNIVYSLEYKQGVK